MLATISQTDLFWQNHATVPNRNNPATAAPSPAITTNLMPSFFSSVCLRLQIALQILWWELTWFSYHAIEMWGRHSALWAQTQPGVWHSQGSLSSSQLLHPVLTIFASAQPSSDCYGDVELLPFSEWEEFKLFYGSHTFLHLVSYTQPGRNTRLRDGTERTPSANRSVLRN